MSKTVLVVDDNIQHIELVAAYMETAPYTVIKAMSAQEGLDSINSKRQIDCIVLDLTLPDEDGLVLLRKIINSTDIPTIICSARTSDEDRITGLEIGARDYLAKPFSPKELLLRVRNLINTSSKSNDSNTIAFHGFTIDLDMKSLTASDGRDIELTYQEYLILSKLASRVGKTFSRTELIDNIASLDGPENERAIDVTISRLRKKLEQDTKKPKILVTKKGFGYEIAAD